MRLTALFVAATLTILMLVVGCEKTIHEVRAPVSAGVAR